MANNTKLSQFESITSVDETSYIPIITGNPLTNKKILANDLLSFATGNTTGGTIGGYSIIDVTYSELTGLTSTSGLTEGNSYKITDYKTIHYIFNDNGVRYNINSGETEPLVVKAISNNNVSQIAYSEKYPNDVIYYDWNPDNTKAINELYDSNGVVPGFKGLIYRRIDTINNNDIGYDFRNVKFRRWKLTSVVWVNGNTYSNSQTVKNGTNIYTSLISNNNHPIGDPNYWAQIAYSGSVIGEYLSSNNSTNNVPLDDYVDLYTFNTNGTYENSFKNITIETTHSGGTYNPTIFSNNVFSGWAHNCNLLNNTSSNTIVGSTNIEINFGKKNLISSSDELFSDIYFENNYLYTCGYMKVNGNDNIFTNCHFSNGFLSKSQLLNTSYCNFIVNTSISMMGASHNNFNSGINNVKLNAGSKFNDFKSCQSNLDLSSFTQFSSAYNCEIFISSNGKTFLRYFDGNSYIFVDLTVPATTTTTTIGAD